MNSALIVINCHSCYCLFDIKCKFDLIVYLCKNVFYKLSIFRKNISDFIRTCVVFTYE